MARNSAREAQWMARCSRVGEWLEALDEGRGTEGVPAGVLTSIHVRMPTEDNPETLLVVKVEGSEGKVIGFVGAMGLAGAMLAWRAKDRTSGLKWREDLPYEQRVR